ncbi:MAG TPA: metallophosphoesterase family protein [Gemmatimonadales bacterium]|nr:metallophosphoesterase family protein [Gemmatimonadales bacterium]
MRRLLPSLALLAIVGSCSPERAVLPTPSMSTGIPLNLGSKERYTLAVVGDMPYGTHKLDSLPLLIDLINSDPKVDLVAHLGDIKAGSNSPCTNEYIDSIRVLFDHLKDPFVYTPGDNEWTDCHVGSKNNGLYTPTERLQFVRQVFFPVAGQTLGGRKKQVLTEADDPANAQYVENTMWMESQVVFAALNLPGSNDDKASWGSTLPSDAGNYPSQATERDTRKQANLAWLDKAFTIATDKDAAGVVLLFQADMWDTTTSISGYDTLVVRIGNLAATFGKPVLLLEGDSHIYSVDYPYSPSSPLHSKHPSTPVAENVTRIVVEGDGNRTEYLRLTIDPQQNAGQLFSWERVPLN